MNSASYRTRGQVCIALVAAAITSQAASFKPADEIVVVGTNYAPVYRMSGCVDLDGNRVLAKGTDPVTNQLMFLFQRHVGGPDAWGLSTVIAPPSGTFGFPMDLALKGDLAAVGDIYDNTAAPHAGGVLLFQRNHPTNDAWGLVKTLTAPGSATNGQFGMRVGTDGRYLAASFNLVSTNNTVLLFEKNAGGADNWGLIKQFTTTNARAYLRASTDVQNDRLVIGCFAMTSNQYAEIRERNAGGADNWGVVKTLVPPPNLTNYYGISVALDGDAIAVGAYLDADAGTNGAGAVYLYRRNVGGPDNWGLVGKYLPTSTGAVEFGRTVDLRGDTLVAGAVSDRSVTTNHANGAAYVFQRNEGGADNWGLATKLISRVTTYQMANPGERGVSMGDDMLAAATSPALSPGEVGGARLFQSYDCPVWAELDQKLPAAASNEDRFGTAVALDDNWMAVGAPKSSVFGNPEIGRVYLYERNAGGANKWALSYTFGGGADWSNHFGAALALNRERLAVGLPDGDSQQTPHFTGQVKLHERNKDGSNAWGVVATCLPADGADYDQFGSAIALEDDILVVGAPVNDAEGAAAGAAYVFMRNQGGSNRWGQVLRLEPTGLDAADRFGTSVAIEGDTIAVGAPLENDGAGADGAVYLFRQNQGGSNTWGQIKKIKVGTPTFLDRVGSTVALAGDVLVVGADQDGESQPGSGAAYVFERNLGGPDNWGLVKKIKRANPEDNAQFGCSVAAHGDRILIAARYDLASHGTASLYGRNVGGANQWGLLATFEGEYLDIASDYGSSVALQAGLAVVGAPRDDTGTRTNVGRVFMYEPSCLAVSTTNDTVAGDGETSLREAIDEANASTASALAVVIPEGFYPLGLAGSEENENATGDFDITNRTTAISLLGQGARGTILDGQDLDRVLHLQAGTTGTVSGLTIRNGKTSNGTTGTGASNGTNGRDGGGIFNNGTWTIANCTIISNTAGNGGGAQSGQGTTAGRGGRGGGLYNIGILTVRDSTLARNATGYGGAGDTSGNGGNGGGIFDSGGLTVQNSTIWNNFTGDATGPGAHDGYGAGIYSDGGIAVLHCTIAKNQAGNGLGGGLYVSSASAFNFSVLDDNLGANGGIDGYGTLSSPSYNLISVTNGLTFAGSPISNLLSVSAQLGSSPTNALGSTDVLLPQASSPVINKGSAAFGPPLATDQRGFLRPTNGLSIDLGAVELATDFDGDGMDDAWELAQWTNPEQPADAAIDYDGDGASTFDEYIADTNPYDAFDLWAIDQIVQTNGVRVYFDSSAARKYSLGYRTNLVDGGAGLVAGQINVTGAGGSMSLVDTNNISGRFYGIRVSLP